MFATAKSLSLSPSVAVSSRLEAWERTDAKFASCPCSVAAERLELRPQAGQAGYLDVESPEFGMR